MTRISRRKLLLGAGAGLLVAANKRRIDDDEKLLGPTATLGMTGVFDLYGEPATLSAPPNANVDFKPRYLCVLYARFSDDKKLRVRTCHVELPMVSPNEEQVKSIAKPILDLLHRNQYASVQAEKKTKNLDELFFGSQHILVIYIDHNKENIRFDTRFMNSLLIRFTKYSSRDITKPIEKNNAFFGLKKLTFDDPDPLRSDVAYQLDYWNTDINGNETPVYADRPSTHRLYSMNIHLQMSVETEGQELWVPVILDPDTGNMGGTP